MSNVLHKTFQFLASLKFAVLVILSLGVVSAYGTFMEAAYDTNTAQILVYHSWFMYLTMAFLVVSLVFSAVERLPWKKRHIGFVITHIGIIILIFGAFVTQRRGIDGTMVFDIGESSKWVSLPRHTDLLGYETEDGNFFKEIHRDEVGFLKSPPTEKKPYLLKASNGDEISVVEYWPYARRKSEVVASERKQDGPGLRFQLKNPNVNIVEWVVQEGDSQGRFDMGPAKVILSREGKEDTPKGNAIVVVPSEDPESFHYMVFTDSKGGLTAKGKAKVGDVISTGWMGLEFRAFQFLPHATRSNTYERLEKPNPQSISAMRVRFKGQEHWLGLNSVLRLFTDNIGYILTYQNRRIDLGFDLKLKKFEVGRYPGTMMAMKYESVVETPEGESHVISMNEPLKYKNFTFYQASFQENEMGQPIASVLSVNDDPGRWIKYLGASLILLGSLLLFYFRKLFAGSGPRNKGA